MGLQLLLLVGKDGFRKCGGVTYHTSQVLLIDDQGGAHYITDNIACDGCGDMYIQTALRKLSQHLCIADITLDSLKDNGITVIIENAYDVGRKKDLEFPEIYSL